MIRSTGTNPFLCINAHLLSANICVPSNLHIFLQRVPQPLLKIAFWKGTKFQAFFFHYSLPILSVVMEQVYFNHFKLLYLGISLLCQNSVSAADIALSQSLLDEYVKQYQNLYGMRHMSFNVHLLRHLPKVVEELGPLWTTTCFMFEDLNGSLKHLAHGTQYAGVQVLSNFELLTRLPVIINEDLKPGKIKTFRQKMCSRFSLLRLQSVSKNVSIVGSLMKNVSLFDNVQPVVSSIIGNDTLCVQK